MQDTYGNLIRIELGPELTKSVTARRKWFGPRPPKGQLLSADLQSLRLQLLEGEGLYLPPVSVWEGSGSGLAGREARVDFGLETFVIKIKAIPELFNFLGNTVRRYNALPNGSGLIDGLLADAAAAEERGLYETAFRDYSLAYYHACLTGNPAQRALALTKARKLRPGTGKGI